MCDKIELCILEVEVIVFISKDNHLNKAYIKYLELSFYNLARDVGQYRVMN
jgi:hypothetical protein